MERGVSIDEDFLHQTTSSSASWWWCYVGWEELWVCGERGRREVHYYLKKKDGSKDLAVIGKEKSLRHMVYYFYNNNMAKHVKNSIFFKLKSRREVINWLNSIIPGSDLPVYQPCRPIEEHVESKDAPGYEVDNMKDVQMRKMGRDTTEFMWLGSSWTCRKKRRHYQSFRRNGVHIYVHDFIYVLAEEDKRLVAHLDDMYEDSRGNKMVVVRWFHKIDEVGIVLPQNYNDREIFFSRCLQDLSIECIDGLATILSPQHYETFRNEARNTSLEPFICHMQFENDDVKPFDITQVKGYWKQDVLKSMSLSSPSKSEQFDDGLKTEGNLVDAVGSSRPLKRLRRSSEADHHLHPTKVSANSRNESDADVSLKEGCSVMPSPVEDSAMQQHIHHFVVGAQVEMLSQDSGIRGCWFRASILKKRKDKVKVQYQDIKDAADEAKNLEEWVLSTRLAIPDESGIRNCGRAVVRPTPPCNTGGVYCVSVGTIVDAWWHDGWWEGIVVKKESEDKLHVYFPGEKRELSFSCGDLRYSQEWLENKWNHLKERPDIVSMLSRSEPKKVVIECSDVKPNQVAIRDDDKDVLGAGQKNNVGCGSATVDARYASGVVRDLSKDDLLNRLRWKSWRKRRPCRSRVHKMQHYAVDLNRTGSVDTRMQTSERFLIRSSWKVDTENCKYSNDSHFSSSAVSHLTDWVMSR